MLTRRLLRIKTFQTLYAYMEQEDALFNTFESFLLGSINNVYDYYLFLLQLPAELGFFVENEFNPVTRKYLPTPEDEKTVKAFSQNEQITRLSNSDELIAALKKVKLNWNQHKDLMQSLAVNFRESDFFRHYLKNPAHSAEEQLKFLDYLYNEIIFKSEVFTQLLEEMNMHWNDDMISIGKAVNKTLESMKVSGAKPEVLPFSKNLEEDIEFTRNLFRNCVRNRESLESLIAERTRNWDKERISSTDFILLKMAVCEMLDFPYIPVKVTINEYLEIAKAYSTPNSSKFLNGVLDKILADLRNEQKIVKQGRGLME